MLQSHQNNERDPGHIRTGHCRYLSTMIVKTSFGQRRNGLCVLLPPTETVPEVETIGTVSVACIR